MKKNYIKIFLLGAAITSLLSSCGDGWFERDPKNILTNEQVWNDPAMIKSQLANLYDRIPQLHGNFNTGGIIVTNCVMEMITDVGGTMNSYVISICPLRTLLNMEQKSPKKAKINLLPNFALYELMFISNL